MQVVQSFSARSHLLAQGRVSKGTKRKTANSHTFLVSDKQLRGSKDRLTDPGPVSQQVADISLPVADHILSYSPIQSRVKSA